MVAQTPIKHIIFWKTVIKTFRSIYVNCFNILSFWLRSAQNWRKCTFLGNLRVITQEGSMGTFSLFWSIKYLNFDQKLPIWIHLWLKKLNLFNFNHASKQNSPPGFYHYPQADGNCPFLPNSIFWGYFFLNRKRGQRIMELKKFTKLTRVLVTSFDGHKSHHLWNL